MTIAATTQAPLDIERLRAEFPTLHQQVNGKPLVYLDNAATSQKPRSVINAITAYYERDNSNVHRGVHTLSQRATESYENAREKVRAFINAPNLREVIFTRGATEAINLVATSAMRAFAKASDEVLITEMEHHANIVPWQLAVEQYGLKLRVLPMDDRGVLRMEELDNLLTERTRIVAVTQVSNAMGTINPVREIVTRAKAAGALTLIDGAQAVPHMAVDVQEIGCDFYVFSAHKVFGPTGIGVLWGQEDLLDKMPPYQGGGDMIDRVTFEKTTWNDLPYKFEAGTPHIEGAIGMSAAIDFVHRVGIDAIAAREKELLDHGTALLGEFKGLRLLGTAPHKAGVLSFVFDDIHAHDIGTLLDMEGVAVRVGHHCAQPVMQHFGVAATARASLAFYNTHAELDRLAEALRKAVRILR